MTKPSDFIAAKRIVNSDPVIRTFAAPEWGELTEDAQIWIAAIIREATRELEVKLAAEKAEEETLLDHVNAALAGISAPRDQPCPLCDGHGYKDHAALRLDPCECRKDGRDGR